MPSVVTVALSLKVAWWVRPLIAVASVWHHRLGLPISEKRLKQLVAKGILPAVGDVLPRSPVNIPMPPVLPTRGPRPLF